MKKTLKIISLLAIVALFSVSMFLTFSFCEKVVHAQTDFEQTEQYKLLAEFLTENPSRGYATQGERTAKNWLKNKLLSYGFASSDLTEQDIDGMGNSFNLVASIKAVNSNGKIIVGAHYDSYDGQGASDNGTGVVSLLLIAQKLLEQKAVLQYDIELVFFGSEEAGLLGSSKYVNQMNTFDFAQTLLMINLDCVGFGDNLYILSEEKVTNFQQAFVTGSKNSPEVLHNKPLGIGIFPSIDIYGYGYYQLVQSSDHTPFRMAGIPSLIIFSGTYDTIHGDYLESANAEYRIMNSADDTLLNLQKRGSDVVNKIQTVVSTVSSTLLDSQNIEVFKNAKSELVSRSWFDTLYIYICAVAILAILALFAYLHYKQILKKSLLGVAEVKKERVFGSPQSEDVFDLTESEMPSKREKKDDNTDDIFKF